MRPVLEVPNVINVFSRGKRKKKKKKREKRIARTDSILKRQNTTTIKLLFLCEFVTDQASKPTTFFMIAARPKTQFQ